MYGYEFDRDSNSLMALEDEAEVVRLMIKLCIEGNVYRIISSKFAEINMLNRKGKPFSVSTIKNMLHNKKYCGFNVRGIWQSVGLFTEDHTSKRNKKEEWLVQKNDRIEPIISEDTICATKKNNGKVVCDAENLSVKQVETYLEKFRLHYYDNVELRNKIKHKIQLLEKELLVSHDELTREELMNKIVLIK